MFGKKLEDYKFEELIGAIIKRFESSYGIGDRDPRIQPGSSHKKLSADIIARVEALNDAGSLVLWMKTAISMCHEIKITAHEMRFGNEYAGSKIGDFDGICRMLDENYLNALEHMKNDPTPEAIISMEGRMEQLKKIRESNAQ